TSPKGNDASAVAFSPDGSFVVAGTSNDSYGQTPTFLVARFRGLDLTVTAPAIGVPGRPLPFTGSFDDQADAPVSAVTWSFGDGTRPVTFPGRDPRALTPTHTYAADGTYTVRLTVRFATGLSITTTAKVTIQSAALEADPSDPSLADLIVGGTNGSDRALSDGSGLNCPYALDATTVRASGRRDTLIGGGGQDLFYAPVGTDLVLDRSADEILAPIYPKEHRTDPVPMKPRPRAIPPTRRLEALPITSWI